MVIKTATDANIGMKNCTKIRRMNKKDVFPKRIIHNSGLPCCGFFLPHRFTMKNTGNLVKEYLLFSFNWSVVASTLNQTPSICVLFCYVLLLLGFVCLFV